MKKIMIGLMCLQCILLSGCRTAMDVSKEVAELYQSPVHAVVQISTIAGVACEYQLNCAVELETSTVEIVRPESLAGIKASIDSQNCRIEYEDLILDSMMLSVRGMTPADCFDQTIYSLRKEVPAFYSYEKRNRAECLCLTFEEEESGYTSTRILWLQEDTLELLEGEYYLDGVLVMQMNVTEISFTEARPAE